jgi:hypothetical protein
MLAPWELPKYIAVDIREYRKTDNVLGADVKLERLNRHELMLRRKAAIRLFNAVSGRGIRDGVR